MLVIYVIKAYETLVHVVVYDVAENQVSSCSLVYSFCSFSLSLLIALAFKLDGQVPTSNGQGNFT